MTLREDWSGASLHNIHIIRLHTDTFSSSCNNCSDTNLDSEALTVEVVAHRM
jgi:hypothetical protein